MASPRRGPQLELGKRSRSLQDAERDPGFLARRTLLEHDAGTVLPCVLFEQVDPFPFLLTGLSFHDRPVELRDRPRSKLRRQPAGRLAGLGQKNDPRRRAVEPVQQPDVNVPRLGVSGLEIMRRQVDQARITRRVPLREQPGGLVHGQAVVVFEQHFEVHRDRSAASVIRLTMIVAYEPLDSSNDRRIPRGRDEAHRRSPPSSSFSGKNRHGPRPFGEEYVLQVLDPELGPFQLELWSTS